MSETDDSARKARFEATLNAINKASKVENAPAVSDEELNRLIKEAIKNATA